MATISSTSSSTTSSTPTPTPAASAQSLSSATAKSLLDSLNGSDNIDTASLVSQLVTAQFATRKAQLTSKSDTLAAQISGVSTLKNTISDFTKALEGLVKGGTLLSQPTSSNSAAVSGTTITGSTITNLNTSVKVNALATAQIAASPRVATPATTTFGTGTLTLSLGTASYANGEMTGFTTGSNADGSPKSFSITIDSSNNTLSGIAGAINASKSGVTATVLTDADGSAFLSLKGATGKEQAFQLTADDPASALGRFDVRARTAGETSPLPTSLSSQAANAQIVVDGAAVERAGNEVSDLIPGVKLTLSGIGSATLTATRPTSALTSAVNDFVDTYNQVLAVVKEQTDPINGQLRSDPAARNLLRTLQGLTSRVLLPNAAAGTPSSLGAIGVRTNRDGTLQVDDQALSAAMAATPDAVEAMFAYSPVSQTGLYQTMNSIQMSTASSIYGLGASAITYQNAQSDLSKKQEQLTTQSDKVAARMTQQFASMNARVNAYKSTQAFMTQQIDTWTKSN